MHPLKQLLIFLKHIFDSRNAIYQLTKRDFKTKYLGSYLGLLWAFVQPTVTICVLWFVFQVGFKAMPVADLPFILWLITGMIPWFFFSESLSSATNSILEYNYLLKQVVFRLSILPIVKILAALFIHLFFLLFIVVMFVIYGYIPHIYYLQIFYYLFAAIFLLLGLSWITCSFVIFLRDVGQIIAMVLQIGFWATPIFWSINMIPEKYRFYLKLNPVYYITEGYRESFIYKIGFWEHWELTVYFWCISAFIFILGAVLFRRLRPHFADVL
ncbi:MAG: ABC transporter permease [Spirochaetota bacterium]|nr:ABC transporter permease [Spirochaetota bacterium]